MALRIPYTNQFSWILFARILEAYAEELCDINDAMNSNIDACTRLATLCMQVYGPCLRREIFINDVDVLSFDFIDDEDEVEFFASSSDSEDDTENDINGITSGSKDEENESDTLEIVEEKLKPAPVESRIFTRKRNKERYLKKVNHPATKIIAYSAVMQKREIGDGANFVIILAAELLVQARILLIWVKDLTLEEICEGFETARIMTQKFLNDLACHRITDIHSEDFQPIISNAVKTSIMSKRYDHAHFISDLVLKACYSTILEKSKFNVDNVRVCKILGSNFYDSTVVVGMVFERINEGDIIKQTNANIAVYTCPIDITNDEIKETVLIKPCEELQRFSCGEEMVLEEQIKGIADAGVTVIVASGKFGDMALHYLNKYKIMVVQLRSEEDLRQLSTSISATALPRLTPPNKEELGYADCVYVDDLGDTSLVVFRLDGEDSRISTIVIRGSTDNYMDDIERAIDDGVNTFKNLSTDGRLLPGAGATEVELAYQLDLYASKLRPPFIKQQQVVNGFANALKGIVTTLAKRAGKSSNKILADLYTQHSEGNKNAGLYIKMPTGSSIVDVSKAGIVDPYRVKLWGMHYAKDAACTILKIDEIIMARRAQEERRARANDDNDDENDDDDDDDDDDDQGDHGATEKASLIREIDKILMAMRAKQRRRDRGDNEDDDDDDDDDDVDDNDDDDDDVDDNDDDDIDVDDNDDYDDVFL